MHFGVWHVSETAHRSLDVELNELITDSGWCEDAQVCEEEGNVLCTQQHALVSHFLVKYGIVQLLVDLLSV
jgi:hypothetical protein